MDAFFKVPPCSAKERGSGPIGVAFLCNNSYLGNLFSLATESIQIYLKVLVLFMLENVSCYSFFIGSKTDTRHLLNHTLRLQMKQYLWILTSKGFTKRVDEYFCDANTELTFSSFFIRDGVYIFVAYSVMFMKACA